MTRSISIIPSFLLILIGLSSFAQQAQQAGKQYTFKEVGWTMTLPAEFKTIDSAQNAVLSERGKKAMEDANNIQADISGTKTLISAHKGIYNYFNSTITPYDSVKDGDYTATNQKVKDILYNTFSEKIPGVKIDTVTTGTMVDGLSFDQFHVTIVITPKVTLNMFLLAKYYKGYDFGITYLYLDEDTRIQVESILKTSKFSR